MGYSGLYCLAPWWRAAESRLAQSVPVCKWLSGTETAAVYLVSLKSNSLDGDRGGIDYFFCNWQALRHRGQGGAVCSETLVH